MERSNDAGMQPSKDDHTDGSRDGDGNLKRRSFLKALPLAAIPLVAGCSSEDAGDAGAAAAAPANQGGGAPRPAPGGPPPKKELPKYAKDFLTSDQNGTGPDGAPTGQKATFTGAARTNTAAEEAAAHQMTLTDEEQAIMDGKEGEEKAKIMKIMVAYGNIFGAEKLVDLGGRPHSNMYVGANYMESMISMLEECADAGLKSYAPYTVNPRPYDVYNVQNNPLDMELIYDGYKLQGRLDYLHSRLGAPDLNYRSCACYLDEIGNAPEPGTYLAWAESSAVNFGNSALGIRTNRNGAGMVELCAMIKKAPLFGLMTDEGRQAKWLVEIKTSKEPDWGAIGTAIGRKCVEDVPLVTGIEKYFEGGKVTADNLHLLKAMGSATASSGAVGLYHVEGVTPDAKEKGRDLLVEGYKTYVIDDAEQKRIIDTFPNLWPEKDGDPTAAFIGCPHNTYHEVLKWGRLVTEALDKAGKEEAAIPVYVFCPVVVRDRVIEEEGELASRMKRAGMRSTNMCGVSYAGMKGFSDRVRGVTNSAKTRNYSTLRYLADDILVEVIVTGKMPS